MVHENTAYIRSTPECVHPSGRKIENNNICKLFPEKLVYYFHKKRNADEEEKRQDKCCEGKSAAHLDTKIMNVKREKKGAEDRRTKRGNRTQHHCNLT